ncbi:3D domain-containing protein [Planctomycetota bacterium]
MEKTTGQSLESIRLILIVALCVLSFIAGAAYTKADLWITMRYAPAIKVHTVTQQPVNEHETMAALEQSAPTELASLISSPLPKTIASAPNSGLDQEPADKWQTVGMRVTAYCPCPKCCGQYADGMTACGHVIQPGDTFVAADRRYAFGTKMIVPGYSSGRTVNVLDRGGAIQGNRVDVFFPSHQEALEWGVKHLEVKVHN